MPNKKRLSVGDPVVYQNDLYPTYHNIGVVTEIHTNTLKVLWDKEQQPRIERLDRVRKAKANEVQAQCRIKGARDEA
ncbi:phosphohistidine phosphatase [Acinetobacter brisouii]|uniref:phosphohistidine phosphatase n=1 Tax=Acinetobacter brisouii TaxID=396323 RepID=UPI0035B1D49A